MEKFSEQEIAEAQAALNFHPDNSPFWDSNEGQDHLFVARRCGLVSQNTNKERARLYRLQGAYDAYADSQRENGRTPKTYDVWLADGDELIANNAYVRVDHAQRAA